MTNDKNYSNMLLMFYMTKDIINLVLTFSYKRFPEKVNNHRMSTKYNKEGQCIYG